MTLPTLASIEAAAKLVYQEMLPTPQLSWPLLCARSGIDLWVKHENHAPTGAFKIRGGIVYIHELLRRKDRPRGVVAATRGNHGQSIALATSRCGLHSTIVVPRGNNPEKNAAMRALGADLIEHGEDFQEALEHAARISKLEGLEMVPSFHETLVRGVATYSLELFRAVPNLNVLYVPIGLGSGICGAIAVRDALKLNTEIVGVVAESAPAYALSIQAGKITSAKVAPTIADGMACRIPNPEAFEIIRRGVARIVSVSEERIRFAMRCFFSDTHNLVEGAGAAALAAVFQEEALLRGRRVAVIASGANADQQAFLKVMSGGN